MTKFGRVIGTTRWTVRIRLELEAIPDASCGAAGRLAAGASSACPADCPGCGPATKRPPIIEIPRAGISADAGSFAAGRRVRVEFRRFGTALSAFFGIVLPLLGGIGAFFAFRPLSPLFAYFAALAVGALLCFLHALIRQRSGLLSGAAVFPAD